MADRAESWDPMGSWIEALHRCLSDATNPLVSELIRIWGFVGSQLLWMVSPFVNSSALVQLANYLEGAENTVDTESHQEK